MKTLKKLVSCLLVFSMIVSMFLTVTAATSTSERTGISIDRVTTNNKFGEATTYPEGYYVTDKRLEEAPVTFEFWAYIPANVWDTATGVVISNYAEIGADPNSDDYFSVTIEPEGRPHLTIGYSDGRTYDKLFGNWIGKDTWTHITIVLNNETHKVGLYVNGVNKGEADFGAGDSAPILNNKMDNMLYLLSDANVANNRALCDIKISDVAMYSDMRSASEVSTDYSIGVDTDDKNLILYYQISAEDKEKDIKDESGNGYDMKYHRTFVSESEMNAIRDEQNFDAAYSMVVIPDTHFYVGYPDAKRAAIMDYIIANEDEMNLEFVIGVGDMSSNGAASDWDLVKLEYGRLDASGIPYATVRGNHDSTSDPSKFNSIFGVGSAYYKRVGETGGFYKTDSSTNTYICFTANNSVDYLMLNLDFGIDRGVLNWVHEVLSSHPNHRVIVTTHAWLSGDGSMLTVGSFGEPSMYNPAFLDPDYIWETCLSKYANIDMIICGHTQSDQIMSTPIVGDNGNVVYQVLVNNQNSPWYLNGLGNIAIMNFTADGSLANIAYYSTVHGKYFYEGNADILFDLDATEAEPERSGISFEDSTTAGVSHPDSYYKLEGELTDVPVTYEAWVNVKDYEAFKIGGTILGNREKGNDSYFTLGLLPWGQISLQYANEGAVKTYTFPVEADSSRPDVAPVRIWNDGWHHLVIVHDEANNLIKCYIDGALASQMSADDFTVATYENMSKTLYFGSNGEDGHVKFGEGGAFAGILGDVALYSDVRTDDEITSDYKNGIGLVEADLIAAFDISSGDKGKNIVDITGNCGYLKSYDSNLVIDRTKESYSTTKALDTIPQTYEMWINLPASTNQKGGNVLFSNRTDADKNGIRIDVRESGGYVGHIRLIYLEDGSWNYKELNATLPLDEWVHISITHEIGKEIRFYVNGKLANVEAYTYTPDTDKILANDVFYLGGDGTNAAGQTLPRILGDFAAYSDVRSAEEIAQSYESGPDANDADLLFYWDVPEEGKGQDIEDKSGNGYDLKYNTLLVLDRSKEAYSTSKGFDVVPQTYEMWLYLPAESNQALNNIIFSNVSVHNPNGIRIDFQEGKNGFVRLAYLNDWAGATAWETGATVPVNTWVHVTIVHDIAARKIHFYFNGELKVTRDVAFVPDANKVLANTSYYFGGDARDPANSAPIRVLGDFAVYSDARTAAEVMSDYKGGPDLNDSDILLYWDVPETGEKADIEDKTGNGYDLTYSRITSIGIDTVGAPADGGSVTGAGVYEYGTSVTVTATAYNGYIFKGWYKNGKLVSENAEYTFFAAESCELVAEFGVSTYSVVVDDRGNPLEPHFINGIIWYEEDGAVKVPAGSAFNFLLFNDKLATNRIEATFVIGDNTNKDRDHRNGIVFGFTDIDGDLKTGSNWDADISYYWAFVNDWGGLQLWEMGKNGSFGAAFTGGPSVDLKATYGIDVSKGVTLAAEWDDEGHIKVYANGNLVFDVVDETPISGDYYGILQFQWSSMQGTPDATYITSFVAKKAYYQIDAAVSPDEAFGSVSGAGTYADGESVTVSVEVNTGYKFIGWYEDGQLVSEDTKYTFVATENRTLTAKIEKITYSVAVDGQGNRLDPHFVNGVIWNEANGAIKAPAGSAFNFLIFDDALEVNRVSATLVIGDNGNADKDHRNGIVFAFTDHDGDLTVENNWADDISYYWAFVNDWGSVEVIKLGKYNNWTWLSSQSADLAKLGIDIKEGVTLTAEWDNEGNIKVYANGILVQDVKDTTGTPLTGSYYGVLEFQWTSASMADATYVTSIVAGGEFTQVEPEEPEAPVKPESYENCTDEEGNLLNPVFINGIYWELSGGALKAPVGSAFNFLLFDNPLATNRVEATFVIGDNTNNDRDHRNGIVFAFTDIGGDLTTGTNWDKDISYYWAFINDWGGLQLWEMGAYDAWGTEFTGGPSVDLKATYGIDVSKGVTLAAEWDDAGHIKVYANGNLVFDVVDPTPITGDYYGVLQFQWSSANTPDATYVTSFVAGGEFTQVEPEEPETPVAPEKPESYEICTDADGNLLNPYFINEIYWELSGGELKMPAGPVHSLLLFDTPLANNRVEATIVIRDNIGGDGEHRNGIVFALTDHDGDATVANYWDTGLSYYWVFVDDWGCVHLWEMSASQQWSDLVKAVDLSKKGINVTEGVTLAAEWNDEGCIKVYANGILIQEATDSTPLTGNLYGLLVNKYGNSQSSDYAYPYDAPVTSFVAGGELEWAEYIFTVNASAAEGGSVTGSGEYGFGENVTLTATPEAGYKFLAWTENGEFVSADAVYTFTADKNCTLVAKFSVDFIFGDSNDDGKIDMKDLVLVRQYVANYNYDTNTSSVDVGPGADANSDGQINMEDVIFIRKYVSNYDYDAEEDDTPKKYVAFTFDDGPSGDVTLTQKYVYEFAKYGGKATLFLVGNAIAPSTSSGFVYAAENGWDIGIHGYSHVGYGTGCSDSDYAAEVNKTADAIHQYLPDYEINLLRPPYGDITADRVASSQYSTILWSISSEDWAYYGGATEAERNEKVQIIVDNVINGIKDGDIILMHEPNANTLTAMRVLLEMLHEQGYEFVTVSELLGDNREAGKIYYSGK